MFNSIRQSAGALSFGLVAAVAAALLAHLAIDALGDVALARDAYDGLAHDSRSLMALALLLGSGALALRLVIAALDGATGRDRISQVLRVPASPVWFLGAVVAVAVSLLVGMETLDTVVATGGLGNLGDALGGSAVFGLGLAASVAAVLGWSALAALRWLARWHRELLRAISAAFAVFVLPARARSLSIVRLSVRIGRPAAVLHRAAKRGPPASLFA
jgi:hypothetical protein